MFQKIKILGASLVTVLSLSGAVVVAQQSQPTDTPGVQRPGRGERMGRRRMRGQQRRRARAGLRQLNLTDQQKEQARAIRQATFASNKAQREELIQLRQKARTGTLSEADRARAQELRRQLQESRKNARTQMASLLTAEQKAKLEEMRKNRREHRERRGKRPGRTPISNQSPAAEF
ncbi:MAG TPA: Spy/CpxP family protein refolding chaperone [Pyrinomonadaceae bacterium]|nr:Spy/CpxP family protein refolding chaperone [Pyrinomonadaceae bacterium]